MQRLTRWLTTLTFAFAMAGCGGGGGGNNPPLASGPLAGDGASRAGAAMVNVAAQPAADADIDNGLILTRLDVVIDADATVAQVNAALASVGATAITAARVGSLAMTVAVPRQANADALAALAATLEAQPGILAALPGPQAMLALAPPPPANGDANFLYLQRARFPAAWNARAAAGNCANNKITVIVADAFEHPADALYTEFPTQVPGVTGLGSGSPSDAVHDHGRDVLTTLAAKLDATVPTGAHPLPDCLDLKAVRVIGGLNPYAITAEIEAALAASSGKAVVNASFGWSDACGAPDESGVHPPCTLANLSAPKARARAIWAALQRMSLAAFADRALVVSAGGNEAKLPIAAAYVGSGIAGFGSAFNVAATADSAMSFASNTALWEPTPVCTAAPCLPSLTATPADVSNIARVLANLGQSSAPRAANVLIAGSVDNFFLQTSTFSDPGATVLAVGEGIPTLVVGVPTEGTSFSAPQVSALAAYLWLLSPDLRGRPASETAAAIKANASNALVIDGVTIADGLIDAYATVLSLDETVAVTPATAKIRLAVLDVAGQLDAGGDVIGDGRFDLADLQAFRAVYLDAAGVAIEPTTRAYSRFDLNGDGFTGGSRTTRMDLDPSGSTRFGAPQLTTFSGQAGGAVRTYNEQAITDALALCFFATSALYTGADLAARDALLSQLCAPASAAPIVLSGSLTLNSRRTSSLEDIVMSATVTLEVTKVDVNDGDLEGRVRQAGGTGSRLSGVALNGCNPPVSGASVNESGSITGSTASFGFSEVSLRPTVRGTRTFTTCSAPPSTEPFESGFANGQLRGTPILANGVLVAIDFNRTFTDGDLVVVTTGRLTP